jgi:hypothetical protein
MASRCSSALDLIELNGDDLRREPLEWRKAALERLLARAEPGVQLNEHLEAGGPLVFEHACRTGLEGIVSKRKGSWYRLRALAGVVEGEEPEGAGSDAIGRGGLGTIMVVKRQQETFAPVTLGHIRSHGCRDLLVYCKLAALPSQRDAHSRRLAARRYARAFSLLPDGLHTLRDDRCRRAARLEAAREAGERRPARPCVAQCEGRGGEKETVLEAMRKIAHGSGELAGNGVACSAGWRRVMRLIQNEQRTGSIRRGPHIDLALRRRGYPPIEGPKAGKRRPQT